MLFVFTIFSPLFCASCWHCTSSPVPRVLTLYFRVLTLYFVTSPQGPDIVLQGPDIVLRHQSSGSWYCTSGSWHCTSTPVPRVLISYFRVLTLYLVPVPRVLIWGPWGCTCVIWGPWGCTLRSKPFSWSPRFVAFHRFVGRHYVLSLRGCCGGWFWDIFIVCENVGYQGLRVFYLEGEEVFLQGSKLHLRNSWTKVSRQPSSPLNITCPSQETRSIACPGFQAMKKVYHWDLWFCLNRVAIVSYSWSRSSCFFLSRLFLVFLYYLL